MKLYIPYEDLMYLSGRHYPIEGETRHYVLIQQLPDRRIQIIGFDERNMVTATITLHAGDKLGYEEGRVWRIQNPDTIHNPIRRILAKAHLPQKSLVLHNELIHDSEIVLDHAYGYYLPGDGETFKSPYAKAVIEYSPRGKSSYGKGTPFVNTIRVWKGADQKEVAIWLEMQLVFIGKFGSEARWQAEAERYDALDLLEEIYRKTDSSAPGRPGSQFTHNEKTWVYDFDEELYSDPAMRPTDHVDQFVAYKIGVLKAWRDSLD